MSVEQENTAGGDAIVAEEPTVEVRFVTRLGAEYRVPDMPFRVPVRLTRHGLSEIVNHLLGREYEDEDEKKEEEEEGEEGMKDGEKEKEKKKEGRLRPVPFDILVQGEFLRTSLRKHLATRGVAVGEGVVTLEYTLALSQPDARPPFGYGDWVAALSTVVLPGGRDVCAAGGYACTLKLYDASAPGGAGPVGVVERAHAGVAVKCLCTLGVDSAARLRERGVAALASGGKDALVRAWTLAEAGPAGRTAVRASCAAVFRGHGDAVEALDSSPDGSRLCSGSWDRTIRIWDTGFICDGVTAQPPDSKRSRGGNGDGDKDDKDDKEKEDGKKAGAGAAAGEEKEAVAVLEGHTSVVNVVRWPTHMQLISGGNDCALRLWDVLKGTNVSTIRATRAVNTLDYSTENGLCASAHPDGVVRLWDPRTSHGTIEAKTIRAHKGWVSAVAWHPAQSTVLLSASYDGTLKIWDLRAGAAMHVARNVNGGKVLCARWWQHPAGPVEIVSGGVDGFISRRLIP